MTASVLVFDPAMCCSTGVCGPAVDPQLVRFAADLAWLAEHGASVERFNLAQQPAAFMQHPPVREALEAKDEAALPLVMVDGVVKSTGTYPSREQLAEWAGLEKPTPSIFSAAVAELVAIGAAIASNCEPCFKYHFDKARKLGVSHEDMWSAVSVGQAVKDAPARAVLELARRHLQPAASSTTPAGEPTPKASGCCDEKDGDPAEASGCCGAKSSEPKKAGGCCGSKAAAPSADEPKRCC